MTRFELYYSDTGVDIDRVSAHRCPMPHHVDVVHEFRDKDKSCLAHDGLIDACRACWTRKLNEDDLPEISYILAHRYSYLEFKMMDFVSIGLIMLNNNCTIGEAVSTYCDQVAERVCEEE